jgi:hypothetical protein
VQGTAQFHDQITDALFPEAEPVFDDTTAGSVLEVEMTAQAEHLSYF